MAILTFMTIFRKIAKITTSESTALQREMNIRTFNVYMQRTLGADIFGRVDLNVHVKVSKA